MSTPQKIKLFYDPLGNVIRTVNPDNTEQWVIHGKPYALSSVEVKNHWSFSGYDPTPWESYTYDANDLATKTGHTATGHEFTPASAYIDPLGRPVKSITRLGTAPTDEVVTQQRYDIQGNVLYVEDALNRIVFRHKYGIGKQLLWKEHIDSGVSTLVADATGKPITAIDARGAQILTAYDALSRPVKVWAKEQQSDPYTLRQVSKYAENELGIAAAMDKNIVGQLYQHYDEAGLNQIEKCDYKGNPLEKVKQVISDATLLASGTTSYTVDWTNSPSILDSTEYRTTIEYDALNRGTKLTLPKDINNHRAVIEPVFNTAGALERIKNDNVEYVKHIAYNAKGQQLLVAWKNDIMMRFAYDEHTFRLKRVKAERYSIDNVNPNKYNYNSGNTRYDQSYVHDLVGNIIAVNDTTPDCGLSNTNDELERLFEYDALYRLIKGTGRESNSVNNQFWTDPPQATVPNANNCRAYVQRYEYDQVGNMQKLIHTASGNNFTRKYVYQSTSNKHVEINDGQSTPTTLSDFQYDAVGNQTNANASREYNWDAFGRLKLFKVIASGSVSKYAHYVYDAGGQRAKKLVVKQNGDYESVTYVDGVFEYRKKVINNGGTTQEKNYLQLQGGIEIRVGGYTGDMTETEVYTLSDHLGSGGTRLSNTGSIIDTEEYYPYGDSSLRTFGSKRYRYCGKEKDEESGLYYMAARYYCSSTAKFISVDPLAVKLAHQSSYCYADCNPMMKNDPSGMGTGESENKKTSSNNDMLKGSGNEITLKEVVITASKSPQSSNSATNNVVQSKTPNENSKTKNSEKTDTSANPKSNFKTDYEKFKNYPVNSQITLLGRDDPSNDLKKSHTPTGITSLSQDDIGRVLAFGTQVIENNKHYIAPVTQTAYEESVGRPNNGNYGLLDFKYVVYDLLHIPGDNLLEINGTLYNANEAGSFLWGMVLTYNNLPLLSPASAASIASEKRYGHPNEPHETKAIADGSAYVGKIPQGVINAFEKYYGSFFQRLLNGSTTAKQDIKNVITNAQRKDAKNQNGVPINRKIPNKYSGN